MVEFDIELQDLHVYVALINVSSNPLEMVLVHKA
jgi:hypothetical protein